MKINIQQITEQGMKHSFSTEEWVVASMETGLGGKILEATVALHLDRFAKRVQVEVEYSFIGSCLCTRCAQNIEIAFSGEESLLYDPLVLEEAEEQELHEEDLEIGWYEDGKLDLPTVICEAVVLSLPSRIYCDLEIVRRKAKEGCYTPPKQEERTLGNVFADLLKKL
jgi:uncharacterized metal-binding protein YceD (DUF177 family)